MKPIYSSLVAYLFRDEIRRQVHACFSAESEATFLIGARASGDNLLDRPSGDRQNLQEQALEAWRVNPLARRLVELTSQYVVGEGIAVRCKHPATAHFLDEFWNHRLNRMDVRAGEWCDELTRTGNLFVLVSSDAGGMSYVRAVPAGQVQEIHCRANDVEQETGFSVYSGGDNLGEVRLWPAYDPQTDCPREDGSFNSVMLHYAINRPAGGLWGESDLGPLLRWLSRYANWLEDRARLNRFRTAFLYLVRSRFTSEADRLARQQRLNANPPTPGSILVADENETWEVINPRLEADEANTDGLALKKMIAAGAGVPLHFLAEPESSTRTTAEAAGGPTYRRFEQRQAYFLWLIHDVLQVALNRKALVEQRGSGRGRVNPQAQVEVNGADLSARDNVALGMAGNQIMAVLAQLRDRGLIDDAEMLRLAYRFFGEVAEVDELLARGRQAGPATTGSTGAGHSQPTPGKVDLLTGEPK